MERGTAPPPPKLLLEMLSSGGLFTSLNVVLWPLRLPDLSLCEYFEVEVFKTLRSWIWTCESNRELSIILSYNRIGYLNVYILKKNYKDDGFVFVAQH